VNVRVVYVTAPGSVIDVNTGNYASMLSGNQMPSTPGVVILGGPDAVARSKRTSAKRLCGTVYPGAAMKVSAGKEPLPFAALAAAIGNPQTFIGECMPDLRSSRGNEKRGISLAILASPWRQMRLSKSARASARTDRATVL